MLVLALIPVLHAADAPRPEAPPVEAPPPEAPQYQACQLSSAVWVSPDVARIPGGGGWPLGSSLTLVAARGYAVSSFEPEAGRHGALDAGGASLWDLGRPLAVLPGRRLGPVPSMAEVIWRGAPGVTLPGSDRPWWVR